MQTEGGVDEKKVSKSEKSGNYRTPQFSVSNRTFYDYGLIINPKFVIGVEKERCFSFGNLHVNDSYFNEHSRELFELMGCVDLSTFDFRFEDMLTQAPSAQVRILKCTIILSRCLSSLASDVGALLIHVL
jgi:hypothetical protein